MKQITCVLLFAFIIISCKKKDSDPNPTPSVPNASFAFLKDDNTWNYEYSYFGSTGSFDVSLDSIDHNLYKVSNSFDGDAPEISYWYVDGQYLKVYMDGETKANAEIIYKSNIALNDKWSSEESNGDKTYYKVVNTDTTIVATKGTFQHCKKIEVTFSYAFNTQYNYWSDTYGIVYQEGFLALDLVNKNFRKTGGYGYTKY